MEAGCTAPTGHHDTPLSTVSSRVRLRDVPTVPPVLQLCTMPPPHLSWACKFLPCHLRGQEGRRHPLGLAPGAWHWWQGVEPERGRKLLIPGFHVSDLRPR